jgi:aerobic carbon-monoxide dehydrogenase small subunit
MTRAEPESPAPPRTREIRCLVNGQTRSARVPVRELLSDFIRHGLGLTGTHVGCEHGVCGACTVLVDGEPTRSCLMLAVQADGVAITTVEGLEGGDGSLHPVMEALIEAHGLQCGFCTPGFVVRIVALLEETPHPSREEIVEELSGNLCRCTGYQGIVRAVELAADRLPAERAAT